MRAADPSADCDSAPSRGMRSARMGAGSRAHRSGRSRATSGSGRDDGALVLDDVNRAPDYNCSHLHRGPARRESRRRGRPERICRDHGGDECTGNSGHSSMCPAHR